MTKFHPLRWASHQAATGLNDLPRNVAWLLSKVLAAPSAVTDADIEGGTDSVSRMTVAVAGSLPGTHEAVEIRLRRAEAAVADAEHAEQEALAEAQRANALAELAKTLSAEGKERVRQAARDRKQQVDRRTQVVREHYAQLVEREVEKEQENASRDADIALERITAEVQSDVEKAREVAEAAAEMAQDRINTAQQQMAAARSLAAEATAAAERVADEAHRQARAIAVDAQQRASSAYSVVNGARRTQGALSRNTARTARRKQAPDGSAKLAEHTKAELLELAQPLEVPGASRMTKADLAEAIHSSSRTQARL